jgi:hypothetical protein
MRKKPIFLLSLIFLFSMLLIGSASAITASNITIVTPAASSTITDQVTLNATIDGNDGAYTLAYFYVGSSSTANTTWTLLGSTANDTLVGFYLDFNTSSTLEDANDYVFNVTIGNSTANVTTTNTGITIDNTVPVAASSITPSDGSNNPNGTVIFTGTVTGSQTTSCTLEFQGTNFGGASQSMTHSSNSCTLTLSNVPDGSYQYLIRASDGTNTTDSSVQTLNVDIQSGSGGGTGAGSGGASGNALIIIVVIGLFIWGLWWLLK